MAFTRSQLTLALLLAVLCGISAQQQQVPENALEGKVNHTEEYKAWCSGNHLCVSSNGTLLKNQSADCQEMRTNLSAVIVKVDIEAHATREVLGFCLQPALGVTPTPLSTSTDAATDGITPITSTAATTSGKTPTTTPDAANPGTTDNRTASMSTTPIASVATDTTGSGTSENAFEGSTSNSVSSSTGIATPDGANHLYWILPVLALVLIVMVVGGIYIHRYTKKAGYHHSTKSNGEAAKATGESA